MHLSNHFMNSRAKQDWNWRSFIKIPISGKSCSAASSYKCPRNSRARRPAALRSRKLRYGRRTWARIVVLMQVWCKLPWNQDAFLHCQSLFELPMNLRGMLQSVGFTMISCCGIFEVIAHHVQVLEDCSLHYQHYHIQVFYYNFTSFLSQ
jgi:hypothetical protein